MTNLLKLLTNPKRKKIILIKTRQTTMATGKRRTLKRCIRINCFFKGLLSKHYSTDITINLGVKALLFLFLLRKASWLIKIRSIKGKLFRNQLTHQ